MGHFDWRKEVTQWVQSRRPIRDSVDEFIAFFERAFENTLRPDKSWFGTSKSSISIVVGNIYLCSYVSTGVDLGIWMLVDSCPGGKPGFDYSPVRSTLSSAHPLTWMHSSSVSRLGEIISDTEIWRGYRTASLRILDFRRVAADRDAQQIERNKQLIVSFWNSSHSLLAASDYSREFGNEVTQSLSLSQAERRLRLEAAPKTPPVVTVVSKAFRRNPDVVAEVLQNAAGYCESCRSKAPFHRSSDGSPYLEIHHRIPLAEGGDDTVDNSVALCPNCHRKAHFG
ncbi:HNH endonuclease [Thiocapsa rosea]|uniref:HNH endonuclease n=2 Tax=Thiocapsa rosea TaxID=69360 RepID=A0A495V6N5_9GAMM|nr:HNH endonuclease [Thiocapsa rosea]